MTTRHRLVAAAAAVVLAVSVLGAVALRGRAESPARVGPTATAPATSAAAPAKVPAWKAPKAGLYLYHYERTGADPAAYDADLVIAAGAVAGAGFAETRDHRSAKIIRAYDARVGLAETSFTLTSSGGKPQCRWDKPITVLPASLAPGMKWTSKAACTMAVPEGRARLVVESSGKVHGVVSAKVGGADVPLLRVDRRVTLRTTSGGKTGTRTSTVADYFDLGRGLLALSVVDATDVGPSGTTTYRIVETMLTVQPEVR